MIRLLKRSVWKHPSYIYTDLVRKSCVKVQDSRNLVLNVRVLLIKVAFNKTDTVSVLIALGVQRPYTFRSFSDREQALERRLPSRMSRVRVPSPAPRTPYRINTFAVTTVAAFVFGWPSGQDWANFGPSSGVLGGTAMASTGDRGFWSQTKT